jgi:hypothetical protein
MNERIRELAGQAGATTMQRFGWIDYGTLDLDVEKFAELIVKECIQAAYDDGQDAEYYQNRIKQRFGIEE